MLERWTQVKAERVFNVARLIIHRQDNFVTICQQPKMGLGRWRICPTLEEPLDLLGRYPLTGVDVFYHRSPSHRPRPFVIIQHLERMLA
jgi:hypothetical protein